MPLAPSSPRSVGPATLAALLLMTLGGSVVACSVSLDFAALDRATDDPPPAALGGAGGRAGDGQGGTISGSSGQSGQGGAAGGAGGKGGAAGQGGAGASGVSGSSGQSGAGASGASGQGGDSGSPGQGGQGGGGQGGQGGGGQGGQGGGGQGGGGVSGSSGQGGASGQGGSAAGASGQGGGGAGGSSGSSGQAGAAGQGGSAGSTGWELFVSTSAKPTALAADLTSLYWMEPAAKRFARKPLGGGEIAEVAKSMVEPQSFGLQGSNMVWIGNPHLWTLKLDGGGVENSRYNPDTPLVALLVPPEPPFYWAEGTSIWQCSTFGLQDGCASEDHRLVDATFGEVRHLAYQQSFLFVGSQDGVIRRVNTSSKQVESFFEGGSSPSPTFNLRQLSTSLTHLHWVSSSGCFRKPLLDDPATQLASAEALSPAPFVAHYLTAAAAYALAGDGQVYRYAPDGDKALTAVGPALPGASTLLVAKGSLFAAVPDDGAIYRLTLP